MSAGCHALLRGDSSAGTVLVASLEHVLEAIGTAGEGIDGSSSDDAAAASDQLRQRIDLLDARARRVFDGLQVRRPAREDELARRAGLPVVEVIRALPALRLAGLVESMDEGFRLAAAFRKRAQTPRLGVAPPETGTAVGPSPGAPP
jgi:DNA processing protein